MSFAFSFTGRKEQGEWFRNGKEGEGAALVRCSRKRGLAGRRVNDCLRASSLAPTLLMQHADLAGLTDVTLLLAQVQNLNLMHAFTAAFLLSPCSPTDLAGLSDEMRARAGRSVHVNRPCGWPLAKSSSMCKLKQQPCYRPHVPAPLLLADLAGLTDEMRARADRSVNKRRSLSKDRVSLPDASLYRSRSGDQGDVSRGSGHGGGSGFGGSLGLGGGSGRLGYNRSGSLRLLPHAEGVAGVGAGGAGEPEGARGEIGRAHV